MTQTASRSDADVTWTPTRFILPVASAFVVLLGPVAALAPRGLAVWIVLGLLAAGAAIWFRADSRLKDLRPGPFAGLSADTRMGGAALALFIAFCAVSTAWSPSPTAGATMVAVLYVTLAAFLIVHVITGMSGTMAERCGHLLWIGFLAGLALFAFQNATDFSITRLASGIPPDELVRANVPKRSAVVLSLLCWPAALALHREKGRWWSAALIPVLCTGILLLSTSRSAIVGIMVGGLFFMIARHAPIIARRLLKVLVVAAFVGVVPLVMLFDRLRLIDASWIFLSARHRIEIWTFAITRIADHPWFGHGMDASRSIPSRGEISQFIPIEDILLPLHPHNAFLQIWLEFGALGCVLVTTMAIWFIGLTQRLDKEGQAFGLALSAAALTMISTSYGIWQAWWMCGILSAALMLYLAARTPRRG
jgi:exopolysaccharide production protein ExoQ